jgi:hypothetical protein
MELIPGAFITLNEKALDEKCSPTKGSGAYTSIPKFDANEEPDCPACNFEQRSYATKHVLLKEVFISLFLIGIEL